MADYLKTDPTASGMYPADVAESYNKGKSKYYVESMTYPADLFGNPAAYGHSWVMINVNVQGSGAWGQGSGNTQSGTYDPLYVELTPDEIRRNTFFDDRAADNDQGSTGSAIAQPVVGAIVGGVASIVKNVGQVGAKLRAANAAGVGAAAGALSALPIIVAGTNKRVTKRVRYAIQLPMPNNIITGYSAQWGEDSTALLDLAQRSAGASVDAVVKLFTGQAKDIDVKGISSGALDAATMATLNAPGTGGISAMTGIASNPKKEMVFEGVGFRTFDMDYKLVPRSEQEAKNIKAIIHMLKYHMHPEYRTDGNYTFIYPSEFDITFYTTDGNENQFVNKIATCVLTNMRVNYTPDGQWATHRDGVPNAIQISLSFKELSILTKEMIDKGF